MFCAHGSPLPGWGEGRVRVNPTRLTPENFRELGSYRSNPSPSSSPLLRGERRQKPSRTRREFVSLENHNAERRSPTDNQRTTANRAGRVAILGRFIINVSASCVAVAVFFARSFAR